MLVVIVLDGEKKEVYGPFKSTDEIKKFLERDGYRKIDEEMDFWIRETYGGRLSMAYVRLLKNPLERV